MFFNSGFNHNFHSLVEVFSKISPGVFLSKYERLQAAPFTDPYFPFLNIIKNYIADNRLSAEKLLDKANVYPPHKDIFLAFFSDKPPNRKDILILNEIRYEKLQIQKTILNLINLISNQLPIIIALDEIHNASPSLLNFLLYIQENSHNARVLFLFAFSQNHHCSNTEKQETWESFLQNLTQSTTFFDLDSKTTFISNQELQELQQLEQPVYTAEVLIRYARQHFVFLSFDEALSCGTEGYPLVLALTDPNSDRLQFRILNTLGDSCYFSGQSSQAIVHYQAISEKAQRTDNIKELARSYRKTGFSYLAMGDIGAAKRYSLLDLKITEENPSLNGLLYSYFFAFYLNIRCASVISKEIYFNLHEMLKEPKLENMYAYFCGNSEIYADYYNSVQDLILINDEAINYYKKNENEFGLSFAYHKKAIILSNNGDIKNSLFFMKKSLKIKERLGEIIYVVRALNGIGYLYYLTENYSKSFSCFNKAMQLLGKINNYEEATATLYNLAMLYFISSNFKKCNKILDTILKTMSILKIQYFPYRRTIQDVFILKGLCSVNLGFLAKALELIHKLEPETVNLSWKSRYMFSLLQGIVYSKTGNFEKALSFFNAAPKIMESGKESNTDILPIYYFEFAKSFMDNNLKVNAETIFKEGFEYFSFIGSIFHLHKFHILQSGESTTDILYPLKNLQINLDSLIELAKQESMLGRLQNKMRDIRFMNIVQTELIQINDKTEIAEKILKLISHHFPLEILVFQDSENNELKKTVAKDGSAGIDSSSLLYIMKKALTYTGKILFKAHEMFLYFPDSQLELKTLIVIPILQYNKAVDYLFLATQKTDIVITDEDIEILLTISGQIGTFFEKIELNQEILRKSYEDELSGLNNRQSMQVKIREETLRMKRTKNKTELNFSVAFFDLDNFKYYNDNFGHTTGDLIIREFSKLLLNTFREIDFIVRYGGDEFIVLMPETNCLDASIPLERIFTSLKAKQYFIKEIESVLGHSVSIPDSNLVSCSIGLASYRQDMDQENIIDVLLQQADRALYEAKNNGKNRLHIWSS